MRPSRKRRLHRPIQAGTWLAEFLKNTPDVAFYRHIQREVNRSETHARNPRGSRRCSGRLLGPRRSRSSGGR